MSMLEGMNKDFLEGCVKTICPSRVKQGPKVTTSVSIHFQTISKAIIRPHLSFVYQTLHKFFAISQHIPESEIPYGNILTTCPCNNTINRNMTASFLFLLN